MVIVKLLVSIIVPLAIGAIGSIATTANLNPWYASLEKPVFNPPNEIFGPVWTILYVLMGIALFLVWNAKAKQSKRRAFTFFGIQLALNLLWSLVFFGAQSPLIALFVIVALLVAIVLTAREFYAFSKPAMWLFVPYIAWVSFATALNVAIVLLN